MWKKRERIKKESNKKGDTVTGLDSKERKKPEMINVKKIKCFGISPTLKVRQFERDA